MLCIQGSCLDQLTDRLGDRFVQALFPCFLNIFSGFAAIMRRLVSQDCYFHMFISCIELFFFFFFGSGILPQLLFSWMWTQIVNIKKKCEHKGRDDFIWGHLDERGRREGGRRESGGGGGRDPGERETESRMRRPWGTCHVIIHV